MDWLLWAYVPIGIRSWAGRTANAIASNSAPTRVVHHQNIMPTVALKPILSMMLFFQLDGGNSSSQAFVSSSNATVRPICARPNGQLCGIRGAASKSIAQVMLSATPNESRTFLNKLVSAIVQVLG